VHKVVLLLFCYYRKTILAGSLGFSKATVPTLGYAIAGCFMGVISQSFHWLFLKVLQAAARTKQ
jgi:hypothetical protein